jgi:excisionase family DNA binding protein
MTGLAIRCPACGHALVTVDEPGRLAPVGVPVPAAAPSLSGPLLLRVTEAAELLGISRSTMYQLIASGQVKVLRIGRATRVPRQELMRLIGGQGVES